jgi:hypothetical protein
VEAIATLFSRLIESIPALLIILAVFFLALGLAGGVTYHDILPMQETTPRVLAGVACIALIGLAVYFSRTAASIVQPRREAYGIAITSPREGNHIGIVNVEGTIKKKLPIGYTLEMLRMYPAGGFIPMGRAEPDYKAGTWRANGCNIGGAPGDARIIGAYLVGPLGRTLFEYYDQANDVLKFARGLAKKDDIYLPSMKPTQDMVECARVGVIRARP